MAVKPLPEQALLRQLLDYDPTTGILTWKARAANMFSGGRWGCRETEARRFNTRHAGKVAFTKIEGGYYRGRLLGVDYLAHRLVWKWWHGSDPEQVDHENHDTLDNRIANLRDVDNLVNSQNTKLLKTNTSGYSGVVWHARDKRWQASIRHGGRKRHLGLFTRLEEAVRARREAEVRLGFHPNHGKRFD
jgi:hypothetical protein